MNRRAFFAAALGGSMVPAAATAQGSRVSTSSGRSGDTAFTHDNNQLRATKGTRLRFIIAPETEPTGPENHGEWWMYFSGPADATAGELKCNFNGNVLVILNGVWSLQ